MQFPDFFTAAPVIRMHDPLAEFLGAAAGGLIDYRYEDAVQTVLSMQIPTEGRRILAASSDIVAAVTTTGAGEYRHLEIP